MRQKGINTLLIALALVCTLYIVIQLISHYKTPSAEALASKIDQRYQTLQSNITSADFIYEYNGQFKIVSWNNDEVVPPTLQQEETVYSDGKNLFLAKRKNHTLGLIRLTNHPKVKNDYFEFNNPDWLELPDHWVLTLEPTELPLKLSTINNPLYVKKNTANKLPNSVIYVLMLWCGVLMLFFHRKYKQPIISIFLLLCALFLMFIAPFNTADICSPANLAFSSLYSSLGALCILNALVALIVVACCKYIVGSKHKATQSWLLTLFQLIAFYFGYIIIQLIDNSTIPFDITHPLTLNEYSLVGILSLVPIILALFHVIKNIKPNSINLILLMSLGAVTVAFGHYIGRKDLVFLLWPTAVIFAYYLLKFIKQQATVSSLLIVFSAAILCSHLFIKHSFLKQEKDQGLIAEQLISSEDPILVYLIEDIITYDLAFDNAETAKEHLLKSIAKQSYFNRYKLNFTYVFDTLTTSQLSFIDSKQYGKMYELSIKANNGPNLICSFETKLIPNHLGFPELLMTGNTAFITKLNKFDFAQYHQGNLIQQYGESSFPTNIQSQKAGNTIALKNAQTLDYIASDGNNQVIVSSKLPTLGEKLSVFSLFTLCFLLLIIVPQWITTTNFSSIAAKLRSVLILTLVGALAAFAIGSWQFIVSQQNKKNSALVIEKANSVLTELSHKVDNYESLTPEMNEFLTNYLVKFSNVFFTDITLFNPQGNLLASSRNELFTKQLKNTFMHPDAFNNLTKNQQSIHIQSENIGSLNYLSVYLPFRNRNNELLAYLNLPYFAKQNVLDSELSGFLTAMLNLFLLLLSATLLISLALANSLTKPLRWLQQSLLHIDLSKNKPIKYNANNEIAELIQVYNSKVQELEEKAIILAETERNSAWKEMAKQVAHEIKNPLTPMKLQIQYLQINLQKGIIDEQRINKTTASLIEQIDTLARIADEFAHFSTLPKNQAESINIGELLSHVASTFSQQDIDIQIEIPTETPSVMLDRSQLVRVLNNVLKNAQQALEQNTNHKIIRISLSTQAQQIKICIADNAGGIPEHIKPSIFEPKFTTKSQGMGLGLAMCKTIINNINGEIWFEDNTMGGTNFYITIPY
jgi:two-component system nitrogen regulation sensor histidine kinase NtrY